MQLLIATSNPAKINRISKLLADQNVKIITPSEAGLSISDIKEGSNIIENATQKAKAYFNLTSLPILGLDTALIIPGVKLDPAKIKRNALNGLDEKSLTIQEISELIIKFYQKIIIEHGGSIVSYWEDAFSLVMPNGSIRNEIARREIILTKETRGAIDPNFPLRSMYIVVKTQKYTCEQTTEDEILELQPIKEALMRLLQIS